MDFNLEFKDETTYAPLTHVITINDSSNWVARVRFDNNWSGNKYGEKFIHRFGEKTIDWKINRPRAKIIYTYESSNGTEIIGDFYFVDLRADIKNNPEGWGRIRILQEALNGLIQSANIGFEVKDVFLDDLDGKPHPVTPIFEHPTHFKVNVTEDTGVSDGIVKVFALGGTGPFQCRLDNGSWEDMTTENIGGNDVDTFSFVGLAKNGGAELDGSYKIRVRDSRNPRVVGKQKFVLV